MLERCVERCTQREKEKRTDRKRPPQVPWPQPGRGASGVHCPRRRLGEPHNRALTPCLMTTRIFLIAHAPLAQALRACAQHVFPDCDGDWLQTLDVPPHEPPDITLAAARTQLAQGGQADAPTLVLTDVLGATPSNIAQRLVEGQAQQRLLSGVNLPMLLRALCYRHEDLEALLQRALDGGHAGIVQVPHQAVELSSAVATHD